MADPLPEHKRCSACGEVKLRTCFHLNRARRDGLQIYCKICKRDKDRSYYYRNHRKERLRHNSKANRRKRRIRRKYYELLESLSCVDCGESHPACLDFDHVRGEKRMSVAVVRGYKWDAIKGEIAKCEVRCSNCHRKRTARTQGWYDAGRR